MSVRIVEINRLIRVHLQKIRERRLDRKRGLSEIRRLQERIDELRQEKRWLQGVKP